MNKTFNKIINYGWVKLILTILILTCLFKGYKNFTNNYEVTLVLKCVKSPWYLALIFVLLLPNLYFESRKWRALLSFKISSNQSIRAILFGYSTALVTPNRIGEFAGRNSFFPKLDPTALTTATLLGSLIQGSITVCCGVFGILFFPIGADLFEFLDFASTLWPLFWILFGGGLIYLFRQKINSYLNVYANAVRQVSSIQFVKAVGWGFFRYLTFSLQFYLALLLFGFEGSFILAMSGISLMYLVQSYIPLTGLGELGVREFLSLIIFSNYFEYSFIAVFPAFLIWIINLAVPSLSGLILHKKQMSFAQ